MSQSSEEVLDRGPVGEHTKVCGDPNVAHAAQSGDEIEISFWESCADVFEMVESRDDEIVLSEEDPRAGRIGLSAGDAQVVEVCYHRLWSRRPGHYLGLVRTGLVRTGLRMRQLDRDRMDEYLGEYNLLKLVRKSNEAHSEWSFVSLSCGWSSVLSPGLL